MLHIHTLLLASTGVWGSYLRRITFSFGTFSHWVSLHWTATRSARPKRFWGNQIKSKPVRRHRYPQKTQSSPDSPAGRIYFLDWAKGHATKASDRAHGYWPIHFLSINDGTGSWWSKESHCIDRTRPGDNLANAENEGLCGRHSQTLGHLAGTIYIYL